MCITLRTVSDTWLVFRRLAMIIIGTNIFGFKSKSVTIKTIQLDK